MARDEAYHKAEQKIEEARRSGATELDLSGYRLGMRLSQLPESLGQLTQLQSLNLSTNHLIALPKALNRISALTQLQSLDLSDNLLRVLPEWLGLLTRLQTLKLAYNELMALPESLGRLTQLRR